MGGGNAAWISGRQHGPAPIFVGPICLDMTQRHALFRSQQTVDDGYPITDENVASVRRFVSKFDRAVYLIHLQYTPIYGFRECTYTVCGMKCGWIKLIGMDMDFFPRFSFGVIASTVKTA
jgi:hypothetical protein